MVIWHPFDLWPQRDQPFFVLIKVHHGMGTGIPDVDRVCIHGCGDIKQVLNIYIFCGDPSRLFPAGLAWINIE